MHCHKVEIFGFTIKEAFNQNKLKTNETSLDFLLFFIVQLIDAKITSFEYFVTFLPLHVDQAKEFSHTLHILNSSDASSFQVMFFFQLKGQRNDINFYFHK